MKSNPERFTYKKKKKNTQILFIISSESKLTENEMYSKYNGEKTTNK